MSKIIHNGVMYLKDIAIPSLPNNFKINYSLDCTDCQLDSLPDGLEIKNDLILGNSNIEALPKGLVVGGNIIMSQKKLKIPNDALIGGKIIVNNQIFSPPVLKDHLILTDDGTEVVFHKMRVITHEDINEDFYYPELRFYKNLNPESSTSAVQYTENEHTYTFTCSGIKDAKTIVDWHRATLKGVDKYKNYDIDEPRTVLELKEIYQVCTGACETGIKKFFRVFKIDMNKKYTLREVREMILRLPFAAGSSKQVFIDFFDPEKDDKKEA